MTPAIVLLQQSDITYQVLQYQHNANHQSYGKEAVQALGLPAQQVFKTLMVALNDSNRLAVAIVPVSAKLNLKQMAKACQAKKASMAEPKLIERTTGYVLGGVSPLGQKKPLLTVIDSSATVFEQIYVSAGRRGLEIALNAQDLATLLDASFANLTQ